METKVCTKCGKELPIEEFNWRSKAAGTRRSECKHCQSAYMKAQYHKKKEIVQSMKAEAKCAKCGESRGYVLDYHHIDPTTKEASIARITSNTYRLDGVLDEIKKCVVLCANCHREFHYLQGQQSELTLQQYLQED